MLTASALNGNFSTIVNDYNGDITNANIAAGAAIEESKSLFNGSGHNHQGGSSGALITKNVTYGGFIPGTPAVADDLALNPRVRAATTITRISGYSRTAPTGTALILRVFNITQNTTVASLTISAGSQTGTSTVIASASLAAGDYLRYDVTQIGSTVAGANITLQVDGSE